MILTTGPGLTDQGAAVARALDGRVVFVHGAVPHERVKVRLLEEKKNHARARVEAVLDPGPDRVTPRCRHAGTCGGCPLQHVDAEAQARLKAEAAYQAIQRLGRMSLSPDSVDVEPVWFGPAYGTRSRVRWSWQPGRGPAYRAWRSHRPVVPTECPVLEPPLQRVLHILQQRARSVPEPTDVEVHAVTNGTQVAVCGGPAVGAADFEAGPLHVRDREGTRLVVPDGFSQNHRLGNDALLETLDRWMPESVERALELYAGAGNFTRLLKRKAVFVRAIESNACSVELARAVLGPSVQVDRSEAEQVEGLANFDLILVDPPRAGLHPRLVDRLRATRATLYYVSCHPGTFARDVNKLAGFRLRRLRAFDLYPQTAHVELVGEFCPD